jgi:hypothetical protein
MVPIGSCMHHNETILRSVKLLVTASYTEDIWSLGIGIVKQWTVTDTF